MNSRVLARRVLQVAFMATSVSGIAHAKNPDPAEAGSAYDEKGYQRDSVYTSVDGPAVNAFNFNFVFDLPFQIGLEYPENANVTLRLALTYNSRVWHWQNAGLHRQFLRVRRQNPYGLGFDINLGRIITTQMGSSPSPYTYVDSSGAEHRLYALVNGGSDYRTHDGSHIRALRTGDTWTVSFSSGLTQVLAYHLTGPTLTDLQDRDPAHPCDPVEDGELACPSRVFEPDAQLGTGFDRDYVGWYVTKVYTLASPLRDSPASYTVVYYGQDGNDTAFGYVIKSITDQFGRVIQFHLDTRGVVDYITTPAPAAENGAPRVATYSLEIVPQTFTMYGSSWTTWVLKRLWGPDVQPDASMCQTTGTAQEYVHEFDYKTSVGPGGGELASIRYPSGRLVVFSYQNYPFLNGGVGYCIGTGSVSGSEDDCNSFTNGGTCAHTWGVSQIDEYLNGDSTNGTSSNHRTTLFSQSTIERDFKHIGVECNNNAGYPRFDQVNTMIDPAGNRTEFVYRTPKSWSYEHEEEYLHGQLVSEVYYGGSTGVASAVKKRIDYGHIMDCVECGDLTPLDSSEGYHPDTETVSDRIVTTWNDDENEAGQPFTDGPGVTKTRQIEDRTDYDSFGHCQRATFSGSAVGYEAKVIIKDYASDNRQTPNGPYCVNAQMLQANWLGDVVAREEVHKINASGEFAVSRTDYGYNVNYGWRTSEVKRADADFPAIDPCTAAPAVGTGDNVTEFGFAPNGVGNLDSEHRYVSGLDPTDAPTDVTARFTYSYGARESGKNDGLSYYAYTRVIDPNSGLPTSQRIHATGLNDNTAESVSFAYDLLGRTTKITHGTDASLKLCYENDSATAVASPAVTLARIRSTQGTDVDTTETVDAFQYGRLEHSEHVNPDGSRAYKYTTYNPAGRVAFVSEWTRQTTSAGVPGTTTDYGVFDTGGNHLFEEPFGRPTKTTDALGHVSTFRYFGLNKETIVKGVALKATALDDPADVKTRYFTDALGRLRIVKRPEVVSPSGSGHGPYETTGAGAIYSYDVLGRMVRAEVASTVTLGATAGDRYAATDVSPQVRTFSFDDLGHQLSTTVPESGTSTNLAWNALGQVTRTRDARGLLNGYYHRTTYDAAGRATKLERVLSTGSVAADSRYYPGDSSWNAVPSGWRNDTGCFGSGVTAWTVDDTTCKFAQGASQTAALLSPTMTVSPDSILTFKLYREVRSDTPGSTGRDTLTVSIGDGTNWTDIYKIDSTQVSWKKWIQVPAIPLGAYAGANKVIRFFFDSGTANAPGSPLKGIGIGEISVRQPSAVTLSSTTYDEGLGISGNCPLGKPTTMREFDEATQLPIFTRQLHYAAANCRLSDETLTFDWDRDGVSQTLLDDYTYDVRGDVASERFPYAQGGLFRRYYYQRSHGAVTNVYAVDSGNVQRSLIPYLGYNDNGSLSLATYQSGAAQHIDSNAAGLPTRIWADASGSTLYDTGTYLYDGANNVQQIGSDYYRYDADMRLTWARVNSATYGTVDLDQDYDEFGNIKGQTASYPNGSGPTLPNGLAFSGRTYSNNQISNSGFAYDANGRLKDEPAHDSLLAQHYAFTSDGRLSQVSDGLGTWYQSSMYEGGDHRWFRSLWGDGGYAVVTIRDASGQVASDLSERDAVNGLKLEREYIRVNGQVMAVNSTCGPRPALQLSDPPTVNGNVWFDKTDYPGAAPVGNYTIFIRNDVGETRTIQEPSTLSNHFSIPQGQFFPDMTNYIQIETDAACGHTGYSNTVSYSYAGAPPSGDCLQSLGGSRSGISSAGSSLKLVAVGNCSSGTLYNVYYSNDDCECITRLNGTQPTSTPSKVLSNLPCGSGSGQYWVTTVDPVTHANLTSSPIITVDGTSCSAAGIDASGAPTTAPGQPSMNGQFLHWDHLGSTRLITDEKGATIASFKYFPFGMEADTGDADGIRLKFTGHERDDRVGLDYMMARSFRISSARFLEPDDFDASARATLPQSWNRYAYVLNSPINATDPTGHKDNDNPAWKGKGEAQTRDSDPKPQDQPDNHPIQPETGVSPEKFHQLVKEGGKAVLAETGRLSDKTVEAAGASATFEHTVATCTPGPVSAAAHTAAGVGDTVVLAAAGLSYAVSEHGPDDKAKLSSVVKDAVAGFVGGKVAGKIAGGDEKRWDSAVSVLIGVRDFIRDNFSPKGPDGPD